LTLPQRQPVFNQNGDVALNRRFLAVFGIIRLFPLGGECKGMGGDSKIKKRRGIIHAASPSVPPE
jgi:hypothetical protein